MKLKNEHIARLENLYKTLKIDIRGFSSSLNWFGLKNPQWKSIKLNIMAMSGIGSNLPNVSNISTSNISTYFFTGLGVQAKRLSGSFIMPEDYAEGTNFFFRIEWLPDTTGIGGVKFFIEFFSTPLSNTITNFQTINKVGTTNGIAWEKINYIFQTIPGADYKIGSEIPVSIFRIPNDPADTYVGSAALIKFELKYKTNTFGSRTEFIK